MIFLTVWLILAVANYPAIRRVMTDSNAKTKRSPPWTSGDRAFAIFVSVLGPAGTLFAIIGAISTYGQDMDKEAKW